MKRYLTIILLSILPYTVWCDNVSEGVMDNIRYMINYDKQEATMIRNGNKYSGKVVIPERVWDIYPVVEIGWYSESLFDENTTEVDIPASVRNIRQYVFDGCYNLKKVNIHDLESWINSSFTNESSNPLRYGADLYLNDKLITKLEIPPTISVINDRAFYGCGSIDSVLIPSTVQIIGTNAFRGCKNLSYVSLPDSGLSKGGGFRECPLLKSAGPKGSGCSIEYRFKEIIPHSMLISCENITKVILPSTITYIDGFAFWECDNIDDVFIYALTPPTVKEKNYTFSVYRNLHVPKGTKEAYKAADVWKNFNIIEMEDEAIYQKGDVNHDGSVTMADANLVVNYFLANDKTTFVDFDIVAADVNEDGYISMADANAIVNMFLGTGQ